MSFSIFFNVTCTFELCTLCMYALPKLVTVSTFHLLDYSCNWNCVKVLIPWLIAPHTTRTAEK